MKGLAGSAEEVAAQATAIVRQLAALPGGPRSLPGRARAHAVFVSRSAVTLRCPADAGGVHDHPGEPFTVQVVLRVARDDADVVAGFDLPPAKVLVAAKPPGATG